MSSSSRSRSKARAEAQGTTTAEGEAAFVAEGKGNAKGKGSAKDPKPLVKIPKNKVGRAVFFGSQAAGVVTAARAIRSARTRGDRLELTHGVLKAAVTVVTALLVLRNTRPKHEADQGETAEPRVLTPGASR